MKRKLDFSYCGKWTFAYRSWLCLIVRTCLKMINEHTNIFFFCFLLSIFIQCVCMCVYRKWFATDSRYQADRLIIRFGLKLIFLCLMISDWMQMKTIKTISLFFNIYLNFLRVFCFHFCFSNSSDNDHLILKC